MGCATAVVREDPDCGTLYPATQEDIRGIYEVLSTSVQDIVTPSQSIIDWPVKVASDLGFCSLSTVGFLDMPFSISSDTLFLPYDLFMLGRTDRDDTSGDDDQADAEAGNSDIK